MLTILELFLCAFMCQCSVCTHGIVSPRCLIIHYWPKGKANVARQSRAHWLPGITTCQGITSGIISRVSVLRGYKECMYFDIFRAMGMQDCNSHSVSRDIISCCQIWNALIVKITLAGMTACPCALNEHAHDRACLEHGLR